MATVFKAAFSGGKCPECDDPIQKGEDVTYSGDDLVHEECGFVTYFYNPLTDWDGDEED